MDVAIKLMNVVIVNTNICTNVYITRLQFRAIIPIHVYLCIFHILEKNDKNKYLHVI